MSLHIGLWEGVTHNLYPTRSLLFTSVNIDCADSTGRSWSGTGFYYDFITGFRYPDDYQVQSDPKRLVPFVITNRHVVEGASQVVLRLQLASGDQPAWGQTEEIIKSQSDFTFHPDPAVDVAAMSIGAELRDLKMQGYEIFRRPVTTAIAPAPKVAEHLDAMEPIIFVGYPDNIFDSVHLTPVIRRGALATPVQLEHNGKPQFLIDASIFPGSSGSPVFVFNEFGFRIGGSSQSGSSRLLFVGVVAAVRIQRDTGAIVTATTPYVEFNQLLDLGVVYNWTAVEQTIQHSVTRRGMPPTLDAVGS